ncbi:hypothetical protein [Lichenihabitans psoromatis]|uniref:hypothetical protein n=1 Tax=Lichenihabitans psoromatis TaxID=2528642 RepID=UPI0010384254|nr:hypothetical protein [Lichenihabitans psoromatis]
MSQISPDACSGSPANADENGIDEIEAYRVKAANTLRIAKAEHQKAIKDLELVQIDLDGLAANAWAEIAVAYDDLAGALLLTDIATVRRKGWRGSVKQADSQEAGSSLEAYEILTDIIDPVGKEAEGNPGTKKTASADRIATILEVRGPMLRVSAGNDYLRCWVDVPVHLGLDCVAYHSAPFRVATLNLYKLLTSTGHDATRANLGKVFRLRYSPVEGTLSLPYREGPIHVATQRLRRRQADPVCDETSLPSTPFKPEVLSAALSYAAISVPNAGPGVTSSFAQVSANQAVGTGRAGISVYEHTGLFGLDLSIEQSHLASVSELLKRFDDTSKIRISATHYFFSDDCLSLRVSRIDRIPVSGVKSEIAKLTKQDGPALAVQFLDLAHGLARSMFRGLFRATDRLTQIKVDEIPPTSYRSARAVQTAANIHENTGLGLNSADPTRLVIKFLTPNGPPSAGWTPFYVEATGTPDLREAPSWLIEGQLFDIRQLAKAVTFHRDHDVVRLRLVERALILEEAFEGGRCLTVLPSQTTREFGSSKLLTKDW